MKIIYLKVLTNMISKTMNYNRRSSINKTDRLCQLMNATKKKQQSKVKSYNKQSFQRDKMKTQKLNIQNKISCSHQNHLKRQIKTYQKKNLFKQNQSNKQNYRAEWNSKNCLQHQTSPDNSFSAISRVSEQLSEEINLHPKTTLYPESKKNTLKLQLISIPKMGELVDYLAYQRQVANIFIQHGYNQQSTKMIFALELQPPQRPLSSRYTKMYHIFRQIFKRTFNKLQKLMQKLARSTKELQTGDTIIRPMMHCREWMSENQVQCIVKIISSIYNQGQNLMVSRQDVLSLYDRISERIGSSKKKVPKHSKLMKKQLKLEQKVEKKMKVFVKKQMVVRKEKKRLRQRYVESKQLPILSGYQQQIGQFLKKGKKVPEILIRMKLLQPSPEWTREYVTSIIQTMINYSMIRIKSVCTFNMKRDKNYPQLQVTQEDIKTMLKGYNNQRLIQVLMKVFFMNKRCGVKSKTIANSIDIINDEHMKQQLF